MILDVHGRRVRIERERGRWVARYPGNDGKRREAPDIRIPPALTESEIERHVADLGHEWATPVRAMVRRLDPPSPSS